MEERDGRVGGAPTGARVLRAGRKGVVALSTAKGRVVVVPRPLPSLRSGRHEWLSVEGRMTWRIRTDSRLGRTGSRLRRSVSRLGRTGSQLRRTGSRLRRTDSRLGHTDSQLGSTDSSLARASVRLNTTGPRGMRAGTWPTLSRAPPMRSGVAFTCTVPRFTRTLAGPTCQ